MTASELDRGYVIKLFNRSFQVLWLSFLSGTLGPISEIRHLTRIFKIGI